MQSVEMYALQDNVRVPLESVNDGPDKVFYNAPFNIRENVIIRAMVDPQGLPENSIEAFARGWSGIWRDDLKLIGHAGNLLIFEGIWQRNTFADEGFEVVATSGAWEEGWKVRLTSQVSPKDIEDTKQTENKGEIPKAVHIFVKKGPEGNIIGIDGPFQDDETFMAEIKAGKNKEAVKSIVLKDDRGVRAAAAIALLLEGPSTPKMANFENLGLNPEAREDLEVLRNNFADAVKGTGLYDDLSQLRFDVFTPEYKGENFLVFGVSKQGSDFGFIFGLNYGTDRIQTFFELPQNWKERIGKTKQNQGEFDLTMQELVPGQILIQGKPNLPLIRYGWRSVEQQIVYSFESLSG